MILSRMTAIFVGYLFIDMVTLEFDSYQLLLFYDVSSVCLQLR